MFEIKEGTIFYTTRNYFVGNGLYRIVIDSSKPKEPQRLIPDIYIHFHRQIIQYS